MQKTGILIECYQGFAFFRFDPENKLPLIGRTPALDSPSVCMSMETCPDLSHLTQSSANSVLKVIDEFSDVLTPRLGLTTPLEYDIELHASQDGSIAPTCATHVRTTNHTSISFSIF